MRPALGAILSVLLCLAALAGAAAEEPADDRIRAVFIDLKRYEAQLRRLTPDRPTQVARLRKLLELSRQRLESSPHRDHPSWRQADAGLAQLFAALDELDRGRRPTLGAVPPPVPAAAPPAAVRAEPPAASAVPLAPAPAPATELPGRNVALVIGNDDYRHLPPLATAVGDARAVAATLTAHYRFEPGDVRLLLNADRRTILAALEGLRDELDPDDRLLLYYAGHGQVDRDTGEGFWQPVDAEPGRTYTWIANDDIRRQLRALTAKHVLVVADSCFSGSLTRSAPERPDVPTDRFIAEVDSHLSRKVITSGGTEPVADSGLGGHSIFAHYFLKTLRDNPDGYLTAFELYNRFVRAVTNNSDQKPQFGTIAKAGDEGFGDFTFMRR